MNVESPYLFTNYTATLMNFELCRNPKSIVSTKRPGRLGVNFEVNCIAEVMQTEKALINDRLRVSKVY